MLSRLDATRLGRSLLVAVAISMIGCAMDVRRRPAAFQSRDPNVDAPSTRTTAPIRFRLPTGYERTIPAMTAFVEVGAIAEGKVLRPTSYVLTVEGRNVHEAYLVISGGRLIGFYLPFERAFTPLEQAVDITLTN